MGQEPRITFLFPYRWLADPADRKFLAENIRRQIKSYVGPEGMGDLKRVLTYSVIIAVQSHRPVEVKMEKKEIQTILKPVFPNGKCIDYDWSYSQHKSRTMLPLMDFKIYF